MKASELIQILATHLVEHGDHEVFISPLHLNRPYQAFTNCWHDYGYQRDEESRIIMSGKE